MKTLEWGTRKNTNDLITPGEASFAVSTPNSPLCKVLSTHILSPFCWRIVVCQRVSHGSLPLIRLLSGAQRSRVWRGLSSKLTLSLATKNYVFPQRSMSWIYPYGPWGQANVITLQKEQEKQPPKQPMVYLLVNNLIVNSQQIIGT